jgi:hypothetical protein
MLPPTDQLDQISHADLVALVKTLIARVESLEQENRHLKAEIERLKQLRQIPGIPRSHRLVIKRAINPPVKQRRSTGLLLAISDPSEG